MFALSELYHAGRVQRFHTLPDYSSARLQNIADHSWGVSLLCIRLWDLTYPGVAISGNLLRAATLHDVAERWTGDVPSPTKWAHEKLRVELKAVEEQLEKGIGTLVELPPEEELILKWADSLELLFYSIMMGKLGNPAYNEVRENIYLYITKSLPRLDAGWEVMELFIYAETEDE